MRRDAGRTESWIRQLDDASGVDGEWRDELPAATRGLLGMVASIYLPFLAANDVAASAGRDRVEVDLEGHLYSQAPFRYQQKCLGILRERFAELDPAARGEVEHAIASDRAIAALGAPKR